MKIISAFLLSLVIATPAFAGLRNLIIQSTTGKKRECKAEEFQMIDWSFEDNSVRIIESTPGIAREITDLLKREDGQLECQHLEKPFMIDLNDLMSERYVLTYKQKSYLYKASFSNVDNAVEKIELMRLN